nr:ATPase subunit 8 [Diplodactylus vittatus]
MPQLNPAPWFFTFLISWMILIILLTPKLSTTHLLAQPKLKLAAQPANPWTWPWF